MGKPVDIFTASKGLNNDVDPARLPFDPKTGIQYLAVAYNVDHDATGRISRRKGFAATARTEDIHSLFCDGGECLFVTGSSLCKLNSDYSYTALETVTPGVRVGYLQIHNRIYWANGLEKGCAENGANSAWVKGTYTGPDTTRKYSDPPIGTHLAFFGGSIWVIQGNVAWHSETFSLNAFDLVRGYYQFQTSIRMFRPVEDGVFVGTERNTYFLPGLISKDLGRIKKADYPPIEWTDAPLPLEDLPISQGAINTGAIWTSTKGICVGFPGGQIVNLTKSKLSYPSAREGAGLVIDKRYVATLKP